MSAITEHLVQHWTATDATEKKQLFIAGMRECGTVLDAADRAQICRQTAYIWRTLDPEFRAAWDTAKEDANDKIRRSLYNQAVSEKNVVATIFWLKNNCPEYRERVQVDVHQLDREIEQRLSEMSGNALATLPSPSSTKEIINSVLRDEPLPVPRK